MPRKKTTGPTPIEAVKHPADTRKPDSGHISK